jgi:thiosulfate reductase/polysulfide reductase chain A
LVSDWVLNNFYPWRDFEEVLDWQFKQIGSSLEEMKKIGVKTVDTGDNIYISDNENYEFNTNTGKIELYSTDFAEKGYNPLPTYTKHQEALPDITISFMGELLCIPLDVPRTILIFMI